MRVGRWLPADISYGTPRTKPHSSRPREYTSTIAISSATRTGSRRLAIGLPRISKRAERVTRPSAPMTTAADGFTLVAVWWCSFTMISSPSSSAISHSSMNR